MTLGSTQFVDSTVSRRKFDREVVQYRERQATYQARGWWLMRAEFPHVVVAFTSMKTKPRVVVFGALLDFTNYDLWPPSVRIVDPFTETPYQAKDLPIQFSRRTPPGQTPQVMAQVDNQLVPLNFINQAWVLDSIPFICLPGIREYHDNPGHSGDSWLLHRKGGEGTLYFILEKLWMYGTDTIQSLGVNLIPQITFNCVPQQ